ncbi:hypothetical protein [Echinicola rosea]|nr:hypothetical protein [Echinicola rosea]
MNINVVYEGKSWGEVKGMLRCTTVGQSPIVGLLSNSSTIPQFYN